MSPLNARSSLSSCKHNILSMAPSFHAVKAKYRRPTENEIMADMRSAPGDVFPAPLVLPGDDLANDPMCPAQSIVEWEKLGRNKVANPRSVVYVVAPPRTTPCAAFVDTWKNPQHKQKSLLAQPQIEHIKEYLQAFYHGVNVKSLSFNLTFDEWDSSEDGQVQSSQQMYIGLNTDKECIRIRARQSLDKLFRYQLQLNDILDAAISILPKDAFALILIIEQDMYEDDEDDFCCGRAYGGSRVCVVSTARYNPLLDVKQDVDRCHAWPASHCAAYMEACCNQRPRTAQTVSSGRVDREESIHKGLWPAIDAFTSHFDPRSSKVTLQGLWLARVCRTASHELGHCFGLDHCIYYACIMQSTASIAEDARQPPYLCPIDLAKVLISTSADIVKRYEALLAFCKRFETIVPLFAAFAAWLRARLESMPVEID